MPDGTSKRLEQLADKTLADPVSYRELLAALGPVRTKPAYAPALTTRAAAWGIVILFLTVPLAVVTMFPESKLLWVTWAIISVWAALDSRNIGAALSSTKRPAIGGRMLVLGLAAVNIFTAVFAIFGN